MCHQMPLKHLQLLSVFQADNVVWLDRSADGDGRLLLYFRRCWRTRKLRESGMHIMDKQRQIGDRNTVIRPMGRNDVGCERDQHFCLGELERESSRLNSSH